MMILLLILVGIGFYFLFFNKNSAIKLTGTVNAEERLKERFVNGEIDEETYRRMKKTLNL